MLIYGFRLRTPDEGCFIVLSATDAHDAYEHSVAIAATVGFQFYDLGKPTAYCFGSDEVEDNIIRASESAKRWEAGGYTVVCAGAVGRWRRQQEQPV